MRTIQTVSFTAYFCLIMIVLGGTIFSVMVEYPNWFASVPSSLETTRSFYKVLHPGHFFQIFGPLSLLSGIAFVIVGWRIAGVRNMVLITLGGFVAIELVTFLYIYPRLGVLFAPAGSQTLEAVTLASTQFTTADRIRTAMMFITSGFGIAALFRFFRHHYGEPK